MAREALRRARASQRTQESGPDAEDAPGERGEEPTQTLGGRGTDGAGHAGDSAARQTERKPGSARPVGGERAGGRGGGAEPRSAGPIDPERRGRRGAERGRGSAGSADVGRAGGRGAELEPGADIPADTERPGLRGAAAGSGPERSADTERSGLRGAAAEPGSSCPGHTEHAGPRQPGVDSRSAVPVDAERPALRRAGTEPRSARPADVAREALRAARRGTAGGTAGVPDGRTSRERGGARGGKAGPGAARRGRGERGAAGAGSREDRSGAAARARELREMLAGAFRLPPEASGSAERRPDEDEVPERGAAAPGPTTPGRPPGEPTPASAPDEQHAPAVTTDTTLVPTPRSMAAPSRDGDLRRTFPAFPARPAGKDAAFAGTWWGNAWVTALEEGALDANRLARGRGYAERGHVDAITVTPGLVLAYVQGSRPRPYRVQVRLRTLGDADWERFLDAAAERPGHIAALLDKELPQSLADCGVPLLPGPGDLAPQCSCPDSGHPCKHAAALCYQTARLLDADPFVLLLLRGRGERQLLDALSRLSAARAARAAQDRAPAAFPGVRATEVLARGEPPAPPPPLPPPPHPEQPPAYPAAPGGPDPFALDQLATDAAARAHALLTTGRDPVGGLTLWQDAVRLAAARPGSGLTASTRALYSSLATVTGRTPADLARAVAAWRQGGLAGLTVLEELWDPPAGRFDRARPLLLAADLPAFRPWHNTLTHPQGHLQLRLGRDGLWYAYESEPGHDDWWPRGTPDLDPVGALTGLGMPSPPDRPDPPNTL
ncbi:SWIM zinc finger family protein [Streptomyces sp. NPDC051207]|uniref:SWIM zinc finger family protein n=1 Tax=Streptomyces sp. NPDC051207 TaxID=3154641 RepID=UPI0034321C65